MTLKEFVQPIWPGLSDEDARDLLWGATCYPFGDSGTVMEQLREKHAQSNGDVDMAISIAHEETYKAMEEIARGDA